MKSGDIGGNQFIDLCAEQKFMLEQIVIGSLNLFLVGGGLKLTKN